MKVTRESLNDVALRKDLSVDIIEEILDAFGIEVEIYKFNAVEVMTEGLPVVEFRYYHLDQGQHYKGFSYIIQTDHHEVIGYVNTESTARLFCASKGLAGEAIKLLSGYDTKTAGWQTYYRPLRNAVEKAGVKGIGKE